LVADNFQNNGLGTEFMEILIDLGRERGLKSMYATVLADNNRMLTLAKKFGFDIGENSYGEIKIARQL
jgi:acetyltransferase